MESLQELLQFLQPESRIDLTMMALDNLLGLTGSKDAVPLFAQVPDIIKSLVTLMKFPKEPVAKNAAMSVINLSADKAIVDVLLDSKDYDIVSLLWELIKDKASYVADPACMILSNLTIDKKSCDLVWSKFCKADITMNNIIFVFCQQGYNEKGAKLNYLGPMLSNLSQLSEVRGQILDHESCVIQRLLPFTEYKDSHIRRGGIVGTLKNCCFEIDHHEWMLSDSIDILPRLLLPLAGPTPDDLEAEDLEMLPVDLQYLDDDKQIEEDADLRKMLLEAINQLCATRTCREIIRKKCAYFILKELHKVEKDRHVKLACENLVDILIKKEEEIQIDNYKDVSVPKDVVPELEEMDQVYLKD